MMFPLRFLTMVTVSRVLACTLYCPDTDRPACIHTDGLSSTCRGFLGCVTEVECDRRKQEPIQPPMEERLLDEGERVWEERPSEEGENSWEMIPLMKGEPLKGEKPLENNSIGQFIMGKPWVWQKKPVTSSHVRKPWQPMSPTLLSLLSP